MTAEGRDDDRDKREQQDQPGREVWTSVAADEVEQVQHIHGPRRRQRVEGRRSPSPLLPQRRYEREARQQRLAGQSEHRQYADLAVPPRGRDVRPPREEERRRLGRKDHPGPPGARRT